MRTVGRISVLRLVMLIFLYRIPSTQRCIAQESLEALVEEQSDGALTVARLPAFYA